MADSDITVNGLAAAGGVGQIALAWNPAVDPHSPGGLPYLQLATIEVWAAPSNNRALSAQIGESAGTRLIESGLARAERRYYWLRPRNKAGLFGEWHPLSDIGGVAGQEANNQYDLSTNGYYKFPNGLLFQWGQLVSSGSVTNSPWNVPFTSVFHFNATTPQKSVLVPVMLNVTSYDTSGFSLTTTYLISGSFFAASGQAVTWFALGLG